MKELAYQTFKEGLQAIRFTDFDKVEKLCKNLLEKSQNELDLEGIFISYIYLFDLSIAMNDDRNCQIYMYEALSHKYEQNKEELIQLYNLCGIYCYTKEDIQSSINYYCQSLHLCEELQNIEKKATVFNNLALIFHKYDDYKEALSYYSDSYTLMTQKGSSFEERNIVILLANIITCYVYLEDVDNALAYFEKIKEYAMYPFMITSLEASIALLENKEEHALHCLKKTIETLKDFHLDKHLSYSIYEDVLTMMLKVGNQEQSYAALVDLNQACSSNEPSEQLALLRYYICYAEKYENKELLADLYHKYYTYVEQCESSKKKAMTSSYRDQILLDKMIQINRSLKETAAYDTVTGLKNRYSFEQDICAIISQEDIHTVAIIMCDVDNFKEYNDTHGHLFGDNILKTMGKLLNNDHPSFLPYRFGGDEFLCVAVNKEKSEIQAYIEKIYQNIRIQNSGIEISIGYSSMERIYIQNYNELIMKADKALYKAKRSGKNHYECFK